MNFRNNDVIFENTANTQLQSQARRKNERAWQLPNIIHIRNLK